MTIVWTLRELQENCGLKPSDVSCVAILLTQPLIDTDLDLRLKCYHFANDYVELHEHL